MPIPIGRTCSNVSISRIRCVRISSSRLTESWVLPGPTWTTACGCASARSSIVGLLFLLCCLLYRLLSLSVKLPAALPHPCPLPFVSGGDQRVFKTHPLSFKRRGERLIRKRVRRTPGAKAPHSE